MLRRRTLRRIRADRSAALPEERIFPVTAARKNPAPVPELKVRQFEPGPF
jgi:hypothetical protein